MSFKELTVRFSDSRARPFVVQILQCGFTFTSFLFQVSPSTHSSTHSLAVILRWVTIVAQSVCSQKFVTESRFGFVGNSRPSATPLKIGRTALFFLAVMSSGRAASKSAVPPHRPLPPPFLEFCVLRPDKLRHLADARQKSDKEARF